LNIDFRIFTYNVIIYSRTWELRQSLINTLKAELNPICHLLVLLGDHLIFHVSRVTVKVKKLEVD